MVLVSFKNTHIWLSYINIKWQPKLKVNWTQIDQFSLQNKHKNGHILKRHFSQV